jgi:hypothetical protein
MTLMDPLDFVKPLGALRDAIADPKQDVSEQENDLCFTCRAAYQSFMDGIAFNRTFEAKDRLALQKELERAMQLIRKQSAPIRKSISDKIDAIQEDKLKQFIDELNRLAY